jgi:prophage maintenance system killer protein
LKSSIVIYKTDDEKTQVEVKLENETVWLSLNQMAVLFQRDKSVVSRHIRNVYKEGELSESSTVAKFATVQKEGNRSIEREIEFYNLDVIISVGYRVKSKRGTQFRIWANRVLKEYLIQGYALNQKVLESQKDKLHKINEAISLISKLNLQSNIDTETKSEFLSILDKYSSALMILDDYDNQRVSKPEYDYEKSYIIKYDEVINAVNEMKGTSANSALFGKQKDNSLKSSISAIYQTFDGIDLYPTILEKAINLLYFMVKNHSFVDGNKRIAATIFLYFLKKNNKLENINLDNNLLASMTLLIANSNPQERDLIISILSIMLMKDS